MEYKLFGTIFFTVLLAELGDKTQLATMLFAADKEVSKWMVFAAASLALVVASAIGVAAGHWLSQHIDAKQLSTVAGIGFIAIGIWTLWR